MNRHLAIVFLWLLSAPVLPAAELQVGGVFPGLILQDQHENKATVPSDAGIVVFAADKAGADLVNAYLKDQPAKHLLQRRARFVSDISGMPSMITRMFALPRMREYPYPIYLVRDEGSVSFIPRRKGHVTVMYLQEGKITGISYVSREGDFDNVFNPTASGQQ